MKKQHPLREAKLTVKYCVMVLQTLDDQTVVMREPRHSCTEFETRTEAIEGLKEIMGDLKFCTEQYTIIEVFYSQW